MNNGLATQIRGTFEALDDAQTPVTVEEIMHRAGPVRPLPVEEPQTVGRNWRVPVLVAAVAAAVVLIALIPVLFLNTQPDQTPATTPSTVTSTTTDGAVTTTIASQNTEEPTIAAPPAASVPVLVDPFDLPRATDAGWTWQPLPPGALHPGSEPLSSGRYVRYDKGWECYDEGFFLTETEDGCADPVIDPVEGITWSIDGETWTAGTTPVGPNGWNAGYYLFNPGAVLYMTWSPLGETISQWFGTHDGETWFEPSIDGTPFEPPNSLATRTIWVGDIVILPREGAPNAPAVVSVDAGRTFKTVPEDISEYPHTVYEIEGRLEAIVWSETTDEALDYADPTLWRSTNGIDWAEVGTVTGLPPLSTDPVRDGAGGQVTAAQWRLGSLTAPIHTISVLGNGNRLAVGSVLERSTQMSWGPEDSSVVAISTDGLAWTITESVRPIRGGLGDKQTDRGETVNGWFVAGWEECFSDREACTKGVIGTPDGRTWFRFIGPDDRRLTVNAHPQGVSAALIKWIYDTVGTRSSSVVDGEEYLATPPVP